ncbi:hypothetical protein BT96DRAFT_960773 [Gymnopus androsaceus JB14]|uniref:Reverse transcriptase domain-containing protein n=1 Tax=Gymnopus androsaceus JB14 TaxID=1447944 RepID=A0A6A4GJ56_9AGAR|nr:hypothetical protein BT96DRAFT_960773 [Gymnopus androsaceus JB14]
MIRESDLKGYKIPQEKERLIVNLFADDTSAFLDAADKFEDLQTLLDKWCFASGAKFNIGKTNIIPIGVEEYCKEVILTRRTGPNMTPLPANLHIAVIGEAVRILGAWFGNKIDAEHIWAPVMEKIDTHLARWARGGPTLEGRRQIIQMVIGGMTQYLTVVQGMPATVEKRLTKRINTFLWKEKGHNPVNQKVILGPIEKGGRKTGECGP